MARPVGETEVGILVAPKRPIISVPEEASVQTALKVMLAHSIVAVPVSAPPGKWLGAGASTVVDGDKQYIGMVSLVDVALHLARWRCAPGALEQPVRDLIGSSPEGLSVWVFPPETKLADVLEPLSKGVHRILICSPPQRATQGMPAELASEAERGGTIPPPDTGEQNTQQDNTTNGARSPRSGVKRPEYHFLSQTDVVSFLLSRVDDLGAGVRRTLTQLSLVDLLFPPLAVSESETVLSVLRLLKRAPGIRAVAVVADEGRSADVAHAGSSDQGK